MTKLRQKIFYYKLDNVDIPVIITYKNIKNKIFRYDLKSKSLKISCPSFIKEKELIKDLDKSQNNIRKWLKSDVSKLILKENEMYFFGKKYTLIKADKFSVSDDIIFYDNHDKIINAVLAFYNDDFTKVFQDLSMTIVQNYQIPNLIFKRVNTYWGQYNKKYHRITLNQKLVHYPWEVIKYVIIHELTHIKEMSHNKKFYQLLSEHDSSYKESIKILKEKRYG